MPLQPRSLVTLSAKGQITLPQAMLERLKWGAGARLVVEETSEGILLKPAPLFERKTADEVIGILNHAGPPHTIEDMNEAVLTEAKRHHARRASRPPRP